MGTDSGPDTMADDGDTQQTTEPLKPVFCHIRVYSDDRDKLNRLGFKAETYAEIVKRVLELVDGVAERGQ